MAGIRLKPKIPGVPAGAVGCSIQDPGPRGYWGWKTADFSQSAGTARAQRTCTPIRSACTLRMFRMCFVAPHQGPLQEGGGRGQGESATCGGEHAPNFTGLGRTSCEACRRQHARDSKRQKHGCPGGWLSTTGRGRGQGLEGQGRAGRRERLDHIFPQG